jgi:hypothetical protein
MKKLFFCFLITCFALPATALAECEVKLEWTPQGTNDEIAGYMIFCREKGKEYDYRNPIWEGDSTFLKCTIDGLERSKTYFFVIRSVDRQDNQSHDSPEVQFSNNRRTITDAGLSSPGQNVSISSDTSFSSCFVQTLSR